MRVIADSGSTKTHWRIMFSGGTSESLYSVGLNPFFTESEDIVEIVRQCFYKYEPERIEEVYFYGAGCADEEKCNLVRGALTQIFSQASIEVYSDLLASAHALFGNQPGVACILGTGSNAAVYDGELFVDKVNSLGYILGDEGSGAYIGKQLLQSYFRKEMPQKIRKSFQEQYVIDKQTVLSNIYREPFPNRYLASFAVFASKYSDTDFMQTLLRDSFTHFVDYQLRTLSFDSSMKVGFVGSISYYFKDILMEVFRIRGFRIGQILKEPIYNLEQYYSNKN